MTEIDNITEYEKFNLSKAQEKKEDHHILLEDMLNNIIEQVEKKKEKDKKQSQIWWGARKTAEMSVIVAVLWWSLNNLQENYERSFEYIDNRIELIRDSVGKVTLDNEQAVIIMTDMLKVHHSVELSYYEKLLTARYPQECIKDKNITNCKKKIKSDVQRRVLYFNSKLSKFSSKIGVLSNYFRKSYLEDKFIEDVSTILFSNLRKNIKMDSLKVLLSDYETEFIRDFQKVLEESDKNKLQY